MDFQAILDSIAEEVQPLLGQGKVATYIPALARVPIRQFGMALRTVEGEEVWVGDARIPFSIQSVSKVFTLSLAMRLLGEKLWQRVGWEPSGNPFNSLIQLEREHGIPRNPFINAGAIVIADGLLGHCADPKAELLALMSGLCGETVSFDAEVAASEAATGFRNVALANFMKSFSRIEHPVDKVLDLYFHQCALALSCQQLARASAFLCHDGRNPQSGAAYLTERQTRRINALMLTCGTYDMAGEFAFLIGLPCKSGVGGGIIAIVPDRLSLCVWSPGLEPSGNSLAGMRALELFSAKTGLSIF